MTDAGAYALSPSSYGTFDQGGNAREFLETRFGFDREFPGLRGGSTYSGPDALQAASFGYNNPRVESSAVGFRVASSASIPEPGSAWLAAMAAVWVNQRHRASWANIVAAVSRYRRAKARGWTRRSSYLS
jgi:hypothetical protein